MNLKSLDDAFALLNSDMTVVTAMATAEPLGFYRELASQIRLRNLKGLRVIGANPSKVWPCFSEPDMRERVRFALMFLTHAIRKIQGHGFIDYIPQHLSQWAQNLKMTSKPIHIFWGTCSLPDPRGFVSLGLNNCYESDILRAADKVILEINPRMPRTFGSTEVHVNEVDVFVDPASGSCSQEIATIEPANFGSVEMQIASFIETLVDDGSTIQLGIGGIPNAVGAALMHKKDLGVHTEMINDAMMKLYKAGVITGRQKSIWPRKMVGAFALGTRELYDFLADNPMVEFHPASVVNDPYRIGRNYKMISINTAVEIDLTGQVCSESIGHLELSGVGGANDTHLGAQLSKNGRAIVAIPSHTLSKSGESVSKLTVALKPGAKVSISRNDIDTVVTEYGVAHLKGRSVNDRVHSLIHIAHPDHRDRLKHEAEGAGYI